MNSKTCKRLQFCVDCIVLFILAIPITLGGMSIIMEGFFKVLTKVMGAIVDYVATSKPALYFAHKANWAKRAEEFEAESAEID